MNLPESLPSSDTLDLAALAAKSAVLRRAASLAGWAGAEEDPDRQRRAAQAGRASRGRDHRGQGPAGGPDAADLPELHVAWCAAVGMDLLTVESGKASGRPELKNWPPDNGTGLLEAWLKGFFAVSAVLGGGDRDLGKGFFVLVLALLNVLQDEGRARRARAAAGSPRGSRRDLRRARPRCRRVRRAVRTFLARDTGHRGADGTARRFRHDHQDETGCVKAACCHAAGRVGGKPPDDEVCPVPLDAGLTAEELIEEGAANVSAGERETLRR